MLTVILNSDIYIEQKAQSMSWVCEQKALFVAWAHTFGNSNITQQLLNYLFSRRMEKAKVSH